jgi:hypothetical protein
VGENEGGMKSRGRGKETERESGREGGRIEKEMRGEEMRQGWRE